MGDLQGLAGIVTGGSSGIGLDIANQLALQGATVYIISRTGHVKDDCPESVPGTIHIKGDITDKASMEKIVAELAAKHDGCLDFLVNNAGATYKCVAQDIPEDEFERVLNTNVKCAFLMSQILYPYLKKSANKGRIINISSMSAHLGFSLVVPYCTSKAAVLGLTRGLAIEWANDNITVNSIAPGWFHSKMLDEVMDDKRRQQILNRIPVHDFGDTKDLGALAAFLIGPHGSYINGQDYAVDGGTLAYGY